MPMIDTHKSAKAVAARYVAKTAFVPGADLKARVYYHGTTKLDAALSILRDGIQPQSVMTPKAQMAPVQGRVYLTPNLSYAMIYALGGDMAGSEFSPQMLEFRGGAYGYVFALRGDELRDIQPDEDSIGEWVYNKDGPSWLKYLAQRYLTPRQYQKVLEGEYAYWAQAGKKLVKVLTPAQQTELIQLGAHIANAGPVAPYEAWRIDRRRSKELKRDGSNFFDIAEKWRGGTAKTAGFCHFSAGNAELRQAILHAAKGVCNTNSYLNCQLFVQLTSGVPQLRALPKVTGQAQVGDVLQWGDNPARHWAISLGGDSILEVPEWGGQMQESTLSSVEEDYGPPDVIRRPDWTAKSRTASLHDKNVALMRFLSATSQRMGFGEHVYVVGGAVRNFILKHPVKDVDLVVDQLALGHTSEWVAQQIAKAIPVRTNLVTNNYGVAILSVSEEWYLEGFPMKGEVIEIAAARKESYGGSEGKGYKPHMVEDATITEDALRREFSFNTLLWRLKDLLNGPEFAQIIDPTQCGLRDLQEGVMRCPSDPDETFSNDPSRLIRLIKFATRFGFKLPPDTEAAAKRQAPKLKNIPHNAVSKLLAEVLAEAKAKQAIDLMNRLGLLEVVREMVEEIPPFREALSNWANQQSVQYLFVLMDLGLVAKAKVGFLTPPQQARVREVAAHMSAEDAETYVAALKQPGRVLDTPSLAKALNLSGPAIGALTTTARDLALRNPALTLHPVQWASAVQEALS